MENENETVRVMNPGEAEHYNGITLEDEDNYQRESNRIKGSSYIKVFNLGQLGWGQKILIGIFLLCLFILLFFAFLPVVIVMGVSLILGLIFKRATLQRFWQQAKSVLALFHTR